MTEEELAWVAGFIDGEGCISIRRRKPSKPHRIKSVVHDARLDVNNTHRPSILRLRSIFGEGSVFPEKKQQPHHLQLWNWNTSHQATVRVLRLIRPYLRVLRLIRPYLITKAQQADVIFDLHELGKTGGPHLLSDELVAKREACYLRLKELKRIEWGSGEQLDMDDE